MRAHLTHQLGRVNTILRFSYLFMALAILLLAYGLAANRLGFVLVAAAWLLISQVQRFRILAVRAKIEAELDKLEARQDHTP